MTLGGRNLLDGGRAQAAIRGLYDERVRAGLSDWIVENDTPGTVYHLHNWHKALSPSCFAPLRRVAQRLVVSAHDFFLACPNGGYFDFRQRRTCELAPSRRPVSCRELRQAALRPQAVARGAARGARAAVRPRRAARDRSRGSRRNGAALERGGVPRDCIRVLRNPVTPWLQRRVRAERNQSLLYVGRLELDKGVDTLALAAGRTGAKLTVIGEGPLREDILRSRPGADLLGRLPPEAIGEVAARARAVVLPTRVRETFGLVAVEAATSGLPVVSSTSALITGELVAIGAGIDCAPDDPVALARRLESVLGTNFGGGGDEPTGVRGGRRLGALEAEWGASLVDLYSELLDRSIAVAGQRAGPDDRSRDVAPACPPRPGRRIPGRSSRCRRPTPSWSRVRPR